MMKEVATDDDDDDDDDDESCDSTHRNLVFTIQDQDAHLVSLGFSVFW